MCSLPSVFLLDVGEEEVETFELILGEFFFVKPNKVDHLRLEPNEEDCAQNHRENERTNFSASTEQWEREVEVQRNAKRNAPSVAETQQWIPIHGCRLSKLLVDRSSPRTFKIFHHHRHRSHLSQEWIVNHRSDQEQSNHLA